MASRPKIVKKHLCTKVQYSSYAEGHAAMINGQRRGLRVSRVYKCQSGNHWHLTSQVKGGLPSVV